jgi:hypothetical protein
MTWTAKIMPDDQVDPASLVGRIIAPATEDPSVVEPQKGWWPRQQNVTLTVRRDQCTFHADGSITVRATPTGEGES